MEDVKKWQPTAELIAELEAKNGTVHVFLHNDLEQAVVVKQCDRATYKRFRMQTGDPAKRPAATENLVTSLIVWPAGDELQKQFDRFPALIDNWANEILEQAGLSGDVEKKAR